MGVGIIQNLKGFTSKHPPLLVFVVCLLLFGLAAMLLAYVVGETELPNPDLKTDWNTFLSDLCKWDICMQPVRKVSATHRQQKHVHNDDKKKKPNRESVAVPVTIFWKSLVPKGSVLFSGTVVQPHPQGNDLLHVNFRLPDHVERNDTCHQGSCTATVPVCLTFVGPLHLLPKTRKPQRCWEDVAENQMEVVFYDSSASGQHCAEKNILKASYIPNPDLTVMLTYGERSLVNMHLMHTSYFLLVVAFTLLCSILLRSHFRPNTRSEMKVSLEP